MKVGVTSATWPLKKKGLQLIQAGDALKLCLQAGDDVKLCLQAGDEVKLCLQAGDAQQHVRIAATTR